LAAMLLLVLIVTAFLLPSGLGKMKSKPKFTQVFSNIAAINWLSAARFFLFGSRDVWFVVGLPVFLYQVLGWTFTQVGGYMALWIIGYGIVQASVPRLVKRSHHGQGPGGGTARLWAFLLALFPIAIAVGLQLGWPADYVLVIGLILFGAVFAVNSAVHSYLILAYSDHEKVAMNVGFYYMANAGGRLLGTVLSGLIYQLHGLTGCLWWSAGFVLAAALLSFGLPEVKREVARQRS
ncbi:MAG: MFS transporter, partial [Candidatus Thiodiazotropha sp.]